MVSRWCSVATLALTKLRQWVTMTLDPAFYIPAKARVWKHAGPATQLCVVTTGFPDMIQCCQPSEICTIDNGCCAC
jgi:hypothetical protein